MTWVLNTVVHQSAVIIEQYSFSKLDKILKTRLARVFVAYQKRTRRGAYVWAVFNPSARHLTKKLKNLQLELISKR